MKKTVSLLLTVIIALSACVCAFAAQSEPGFGEYKHVFIIGVDGAGAMFGKVDAPNFARIFGDNAYRHDSHTENITVSAQNWGAILCGVTCETHGLDNDKTGKEQRTSESPNNTIFCYARKAMPDAELASFVNWNNINYGIIENDIGVRKVHRASDPLVADAIVNYIQKGNAPALFFAQLDEVDHAGHTYGGFAEGYYKAVEKADEQIGMIYDAIEAKGLMKDSLFIVVADHGHTGEIKEGTQPASHGGNTPEESSVVVAVAGHSVNKCVLGEDTQNRDVASIALWALGIEQPEHFVSKVPAGLFGESREKTVDPNPMTGVKKLWHDFLYFFVRFANIVASIFDKPVK